ncbi:hypothetical protein [Halorussus salinisoli]|uniref:hypothetical protein n=1 Tax=Halorussus salinisoli TaxID=2558242 RepID=UPI0010C2443A|nr:hypothetical protein [Halorussus salinisoli]
MVDDYDQMKRRSIRKSSPTYDRSVDDFVDSLTNANKLCGTGTVDRDIQMLLRGMQQMMFYVTDHIELDDSDVDGMRRFHNDQRMQFIDIQEQLETNDLVELAEKRR